MNRNGEIARRRRDGRSAKRQIPTARLLVEDGAKVEGRDPLAEWDPYDMPILTEVGGESSSATSSRRDHARSRSTR